MAEALSFEEIDSVLDSLRPSLRADGGDVDLVDVAPDGTVSISLAGACVGCPLSDFTLHDSIEGLLRRRFPSISQVVSV